MRHESTFGLGGSQRIVRFTLGFVVGFIGRVSNFNPQCGRAFENGQPISPFGFRFLGELFFFWVVQGN